MSNVFANFHIVDGDVILFHSITIKTVDVTRYTNCFEVCLFVFNRLS